MEWIPQTTPQVRFVDWGRLREEAGHTLENNIVIEQDGTIEGEVKKINDGDKKGYFLKVEGEDKPVYIGGTKKLNNQMGYGDDLKVVPIVVGDYIMIKYLGMIKTNKGRDMHDFEVLRGVPEKNKKK